MTRRGFSLIELLVVAAVLGLLAGLLLPAVQAAREASRRNSCAGQLHEVGVYLQDRLAVRDVLVDIGGAPQVDLYCPTMAAAYWPQEYRQFYDGARYTAVLEEAGLPSDAIIVAEDCLPVHGERRLSLFLDGHVAPVSSSPGLE